MCAKFVSPSQFARATKQRRLVVMSSPSRRAGRFSRAGSWRQARVVPGITRVGGYYGRYNRPRSMGRGRRASATVETKFKDGNYDFGAVAVTGELQNMVLVPQDTTESGRIGRKITLTSCSVRLMIELPETDDDHDTADILRVIVFIDKQANGATPACADILETATLLAFNNLANKGRFRTLADRRYEISSSTGSGNGTTDHFGAQRRYEELHFKLNLPIEYSGTTGAITEVKSNNLGILVLSKEGVVNLVTKWRIRYLDQ